MQRYHRAEQERFARQRPPVPEFSPPPPSLPPPVLISSDLPRKMSSGRAVSTTPPRRRGRDRRSGPRGHRKTNLPVRLSDSA